MWYNKRWQFRNYKVRKRRRWCTNPSLNCENNSSTMLFWWTPWWLARHYSHVTRTTLPWPQKTELCALGTWRLEQESIDPFVTQFASSLSSPFLSHRHSVRIFYRDSGHTFRGGAPLVSCDSGHPFSCLAKLNRCFVVSFLFCSSLRFVAIFPFHSFIENRQTSKQTTFCDFEEIIKIWCSWSWFFLFKLFWSHIRVYFLLNPPRILHFCYF